MSADPSAPRGASQRLKVRAVVANYRPVDPDERAGPNPLSEWTAKVTTKGLARERRGRDVFELVAQVMDELLLIADWCGRPLIVRHLLDGDGPAWDEFATRQDLAQLLDRRFLHVGRWAN